MAEAPNLIARLDASARRLSRPWRRKLTWRINLWLGRFRNPIWLIGEGRSGTTWVAGMINSDGRLLERFEPFHPHHNPRLSSYRKLAYRHPDSDDPALARQMRDIFRVSYWSHSIDAERGDALYDGLLVKDIFATLIARWTIARNPRIRPILLVRNPFAVARSKCEADDSWHWADDIQAFLDDEALMQDHLLPFADILREVAQRDEPFLQHIAVWAIVHKVVFRQFERDTIHVVFYEDAVADTLRVARDLHRYLGRKIGEGDSGAGWDESASSRVSEADKVARSRADPYGNWRKGLTDDMADEAMRILAAFGLDTLYGEEGRPDLGQIAFANETGA